MLLYFFCISIHRIIVYNIRKRKGDNNMNKKLGFIGCGNMGKAIAEGVLKSGLIKGEDMLICDHHPDRLTVLKDIYHAVFMNQKEVAKESDYLVIGVKPHMYAGVIQEIRDVVKQDVVIINIAAGQTIDNVQSMFQSDIAVARVMPNTPAQVQAGMSALCFSEQVSEEDQRNIYDIFASFGRCEVLKESLVSAAGSASGASPAFVYMFIEAMADGAVRLGLPRDKAYVFCSQAVLGAAKMVLESGMHPGALKDAVCSPGGSTIEGVAILEERGMRSAVMDALLACQNKSKQMQKDNEK